jgi:phosphate transport system permease protein
MKGNKFSPWLIILFIPTLFVFALIAFILFDIISNGYQKISFTFIINNPSKGMTEGGIFPALIGTLMVTLVSCFLSTPLGILCAIYISEYAKPGLGQNFIRACIRNLAGVPSIIYGLFGLALFVKGLDLKTSILSAGLTLGILTLPYMVTVVEEALKTVPTSLREAAFALGATQFEVLKDVVLPQALSGIMSGVIITLSRAAGETAPILFTGVTFYVSQPSFQLEHEFMALSYHIYTLSTQHYSIDLVRPIAYGTACVLISLIFLLNLVAMIIRYHFRKNNFL